jgi:hypothetical protein
VRIAGPCQLWCTNLRITTETRPARNSNSHSSQTNYITAILWLSDLDDAKVQASGAACKHLFDAADRACGKEDYIGCTRKFYFLVEAEERNLENPYERFIGDASYPTCWWQARARFSSLVQLGGGPGGMLCLTSFSPGKFGLRSLCQTITREYQAKGIHAAHIIIGRPVDGKLIGGARWRQWQRGGANDKLEDVDFVSRTTCGSSSYLPVSTHSAMKCVDRGVGCAGAEGEYIF